MIVLFSVQLDSVDMVSVEPIIWRQNAFTWVIYIYISNPIMTRDLKLIGLEGKISCLLHVCGFVYVNIYTMNGLSIASMKKRSNYSVFESFWRQLLIKAEQIFWSFSSYFSSINSISFLWFWRNVQKNLTKKNQLVVQQLPGNSSIDLWVLFIILNWMPKVMYIIRVICITNISSGAQTIPN